MDLIYRYAAFTIVAAAGTDANAGLPAFCGTRTVSQHSATVQGVDLITVPRSVSALVEKSKWNTRAWTLQEYALSTRLLLFTDSQVMFECTSGLQREDLVLESADRGISLHDESFIGARISFARKYEENTFYRYGNIYPRLVQSYLTRELSLDEDFINAFTGILNALTPFVGSFRFGLPEHDFSLALLWETRSPFPVARRSGFPSWSWAGWKHKWHCDYGLSMANYRSFLPVITCFQIGENAQISFCQEAKIRDLDLLPTIRKHLTPPDTAKVDFFTAFTRLNISLKHLLIFWTTSAHLSVSRENSNAYVGDDDPNKVRDLYLIEGPDGIDVGHIYLNQKWRDAQPDKLKFIAIGAREKQRHLMLLTMVIEWANGVAFRVQVPRMTGRENYPGYMLLSQDVWMVAKPEKKLIPLC